MLEQPNRGRDFIIQVAMHIRTPQVITLLHIIQRYLLPTLQDVAITAPPMGHITMSTKMLGITQETNFFIRTLIPIQETLDITRHIQAALAELAILAILDKAEVCIH